MLDDLSDLLLPTKCVICLRFPKPLCDECWQRQHFSLREVEKFHLRGYAITDYSGEMADLLNSFKERGHLRIANRIVDIALQKITKPNVDRLIPAPSSKFNFALRGFDPAMHITRRLSRAWRIPILELKSSVQDHATLKRDQRLAALSGSMRAPRPLDGKRILLIDDIVTTGATLVEMARAVGRAGGRVDGFLALAETIPKSATKNPKKV